MHSLLTFSVDPYLRGFLQWSGKGRGLFFGALLTLAGCQRPESPHTNAPSDKAGIVSATDSIRVQMSKFLELAVATRSGQGTVIDSVVLRTTGSGESWMIWDDQDHRRWIADGHVLTVHEGGDTAIVHVSLAVVADQAPNLESSEAGYVATLAVREDTARWVMVRDHEDTVSPGRWKVRGGALEGFSVLGFGRTIIWTSGGSEARALALVDSIRTARKLPLIR